MGDAEDFEHIADGLCEVIETLQRLDYNAVAIPQDLRFILDVQEDLEELCLRYRQDQHATYRHREDADG